MEKDETMDKYFYMTGWLMIGIAVLYLIISKVFDFHITSIMPPCALHVLTGYYCPGCGGTRAFLALMRGQVIRSLYLHPFVIYAAVVGGWFMISQTIEKISHKKLCIGMHYRNIYLWLALVIIAINCVVKNLVLAIGGYAMM